jgi:hypothetical protein
MGYSTNKFDKKAAVEAGGWTVAWSEDITETDLLQGVVAAGVSFASDEPGPFLAWVTSLVQRTAESLESTVEKEAAQVARDVISRALSGHSAKEVTKAFSDWDMKAGAITYSGANTVGGVTISKTWGMKVYVGFRQRTPSGQPSAPVNTPGLPSDAIVPLVVNPPAYSTSQIVAFVNDSNAMRTYGAPVYVSIPALSQNDILVAGADVTNPFVEDKEHSEIICEMATLAYVLGRQLRIASASFVNEKILAISVAIVERDSVPQ